MNKSHLKTPLFIHVRIDYTQLNINFIVRIVYQNLYVVLKCCIEKK